MAMNNKDFLAAIDEIEATKQISKEVILGALEEALVKGYKRQLGGDDAVVGAKIDPETGVIDLWQILEVVDEEEDELLEISVKEANKNSDGIVYKIGDNFKREASVDDIRKGIAMFVKSFMKQKFSEAEKNILYEQFKDKIGTIITGKVEKADERGVSVNIGRTSVYLPKNQMIGDERFMSGDPIKLFISDVASGTKGAHIVVSRANEGFLKCLFAEEIHEIYDGTIEIKGAAREAGERSKVSVYSKDPNVDPAGACIGPNGSRIQKIVGQLGNGANKEKIDIIAYSNNAGLYIMEALKPARLAGVSVDLENKKATAIVKDDSLSMAIGRRGVNARLAVKLTGYNIDIKTESEALEQGITFQSFEELQALEIEERNKAIMEANAAKAREIYSTIDSLPGLPEGYVAPQQRVYEDEIDSEVEDALIEQSEKEEINDIVVEEKVEEVKVPVVEEKPVVKEEPVVEETVKVNTTTSIEELERSLSSDNGKQNNGQRKSFKKKVNKDEEETEEDATPTVNTSGPRMSIYTEEELREIEEEENQDNEEYEDDDTDYDEYDQYYDDDNK